MVVTKKVIQAEKTPSTVIAFLDTLHAFGWGHIFARIKLLRGH